MYKNKLTKSTAEAKSQESQLNQAVRTSACGYEFHRAASIFDLIGPKQFAELTADIQANGLIEPIWLYENKILDGRNRALACETLGIQPKTREWQGAGSPYDFVLSTNLHRRHLSTGPSALAAARLKPHYEEEARARMLAGKASDPQVNLPEGQARDRAAAVMGVSGTSVEFASRVIQKGVPALVAAVEAGTFKVSVAAEIAELTRDQQIELLSGDPAAARKKVKTLRDARKAKTKPTGDGKRAALASGDEKLVHASAPSAIPESPDDLVRLLAKQMGIERARALLKRSVKALDKLDHAMKDFL